MKPMKNNDLTFKIESSHGLQKKYDRANLKRDYRIEGHTSGIKKREKLR